MQIIMRITDAELNAFISTLDVDKFANSEKYKLFEFLKTTINRIIQKTMSKFPLIPLEKEDFETIAWISFSESLKEYRDNSNKEFVKFATERIYWKCLDYACQHMNNKHKILNVSYTYDLIRQETVQIANDEMPIATQVVLDDYFNDPKRNSNAKTIFISYLNQESIRAISIRINVSRITCRKILDKTISELSVLLGQQL